MVFGTGLLGHVCECCERDDRIAVRYLDIDFHCIRGLKSIATVLGHCCGGLLGSLSEAFDHLIQNMFPSFAKPSPRSLRYVRRERIMPNLELRLSAKSDQRQTEPEHRLRRNSLACCLPVLSFAACKSCKAHHAAKPRKHETTHQGCEACEGLKREHQSSTTRKCDAGETNRGGLSGRLAVTLKGPSTRLRIGE